MESEKRTALIKDDCLMGRPDVRFPAVLYLLPASVRGCQGPVSGLSLRLPPVTAVSLAFFPPPGPPSCSQVNLLPVFRKDSVSVQVQEARRDHRPRPPAKVAGVLSDLPCEFKFSPHTAPASAHELEV